MGSVWGRGKKREKECDEGGIHTLECCRVFPYARLKHYVDKQSRSEAVAVAPTTSDELVG